jgi:hypothetical protein
MAKIIILDLLRLLFGYAIISSMTEVRVEAAEPAKESKGLLNSRWLWRKLDEAATPEQMMAVLAEVKQTVGDNPITVQIEMPVPVYLRIMGNAWWAKKFGEISEMSMHAYIDRAVQVEEYNLKTLHVRRNS